MRILPPVTWYGAQLNAGVSVKNRILKLCEFNNAKLAFFHLNDPGRPGLFREITVGAGPRCVLDVGDRWSVVACKNANRLDVVDYSNLAMPTVIQSLPCVDGPSWLCKGDPGFIYATCVDSNKVRKYAVNMVAGPFLTEVGTGTTVSAEPLSVSSNGAGLLAIISRSGFLDIVSASSMAAPLSSIRLDGSTQLAHGAWVSGSALLATDFLRGRMYEVDVFDPWNPAVRGNFIPLSPNPSQPIPLGSLCHIPSLQPASGALDVVNLDDASAGHKIASIITTGSGSGFGAHYRVGNGLTNIYVTNHFPPFNLDIVEVADTGDGYAGASW